MSKIKTNQEIISEYYSINNLPIPKKKFGIIPILLTLLVMCIPIACFLLIGYIAFGK